MNSFLIDVDTTELDDHGVAVVTLNRPGKKNALSHAMRLDLAHAFEALTDARVVILTGRGDVFSAGFDLTEFDRIDETGLWESSDRMNAAIATHPVPVIAALDGPAVAGGADLAVLTDIRLGTTRTSFSHPEHRRFPVVYGPLAECVGSTRARELVLTGRTVEADEALAIGLLTEIVRDRPVLDRARELAYDIARTPWHLLHRMRDKFQQTQRYDPVCHTLSL
ncbi:MULTISPECIES: enoyl-CoA hydratase/isomerase family protein [Rhodococcus]|uniref:enoyl-CoA hydratase/isomerase family protein n=1 Tax=Rhodococcus TaxID=1827 RepID=UPI00132ECABF|nr:MULTISPECIES: enoyl-CoA hydratase/isomerase family protein [Rhodococcus]MCZ1075687.1 enoyl-CoA hydratase/isomerase family protein [Rhodococcus sp. A5(2022)]QHG85432.1 enoyl-CoA hydratase/isomerase family protein [Rhodococcus rhodochrous]